MSLSDTFHLADENVQTVHTSTPAAAERGRPRFRDSPLRKRGPRLSDRDVSFLPGQANRRRRRNLQKKIINYTEEGEITIPEEKNLKATGYRRKKKPARNLKYVDDGIIVTKINNENSVYFGR